MISESICDLVDAILFNDDWDPNTIQFTNLELVPEKETLAPDIPVMEGIELIVYILVDARGFIALYIDNTIGLTDDVPGSDNIL